MLNKREYQKMYMRKYRKEHEEYNINNREYAKEYYKRPGVKEHKKEYDEKWKIENKEYIKERSKKYNKENHKKQREWEKSNPWHRSYYGAKQRCTNPKVIGYKIYGGKGIKCLMTPNDFKELWFRDKAYEMKRPSVDRIDSNKDYVKDNCRYIELKENQRLGGRIGGKKKGKHSSTEFKKGRNPIMRCYWSSPLLMPNI